MITHFIEATEPSYFNWGKFMLGRFDREEWSRPSALGIGARSFLRERGWDPNHLLVMDMQTGEGCFLLPGGSASWDLNERHQVWVCPMFEPFLNWLYGQDLTDLSQLPASVLLPEGTDTARAGYRRLGGQRGSSGAGEGLLDRVRELLGQPWATQADLVGRIEQVRQILELPGHNYPPPESP